MKKNIKYVILSLTSFTPIVCFGALDGLKVLFNTDVPQVLTGVWTVVISLAFLYFFWGVGIFILNSGDAKLREEGKQKMIWGVIALFVIMSIGGILVFFGDLIGIQVSGTEGAVPCPPACLN